MFNRLSQTIQPPDTNIRIIKTTKWPEALRYTARSVTEWLQEADLCLASRIEESAEDIRTKKQHNQALRQVAQAAEL
jgi:hypothetical protein